MVGRGRLPSYILVGVLGTGAFEDPAAAGHAWPLLGDEERALAQRARDASARAEFVAGRVLARALLGRAAGCRPGAIRLGVTEHGRPVALGPRTARGLSFSIAHADGVALCAVSAVATVGADVESLRHVGRDPLVVADVACSAEERRALLAMPRAQRAESLLEVWTVKEAIAKASGLGAQLPFADLVVARRDDDTALATWRRGSREERTLWRLTTWHVTEHHVGAIAELLDDGGTRAA